MELKPEKAKLDKLVEEGFNRTFMELKQRQGSGIAISSIALIGPLWN